MRGVDLGAEPGDDLAVDLDLAGQHQLLALAPRGDPRLREQLLQPDQARLVAGGLGRWAHEACSSVSGASTGAGAATASARSSSRSAMSGR